MEGGLGPFNELEGVADLKPHCQEEVKGHCDQDGRLTRSDFLAGLKDAKRKRLTPANGPGGCDPIQEEARTVAMGTTCPEDDEVSIGSFGVLRNMAWWDGVEYTDLDKWVPTICKPPKSARHALATIRGAICEAILQARSGGNALDEQRAWKALSFLG